MTWQRRIERAGELAERSPVLPELLDFYRQIARFQCAVAEGAPPANLEALLELVRRAPPDPTSRAADPMHAFFARVLLQANAAGGARRCLTSATQPRCPLCAEKPVAAVLRPEGQGSRRFLLCGLCLTEWECRLLQCTNCGDRDPDKLLLYTAEEFPHIRVEACRACRVYLKSIDLTLDGRAVPEVDELASVVLDMWADEHGYAKLQTNLFGV